MKWFDKLKRKFDEVDENEIELRQGTAEFEWFIAKAELDQEGNLVHGAAHLANLLSYDPGRADWLELLNGYLEAAAPNPETLIPESDEAEGQAMGPRCTRCGVQLVRHGLLLNAFGF